MNSEATVTTNQTLHKVITYLIAAVWFINGLFCKVLNLVPRHKEIVSEILGSYFSSPLTIAIGFAEIAMSVWVLSGIYSRLNAILQISVVALMNILEFIFTPHLLLFGRLNMVFAFIFILIIYYNEFKLKGSS